MQFPSSPVLPFLLFSSALACLVLTGCSPATAAAVYPSADLRPPGLLEAGPSDAKSLVLRFDETVKPVDGSLFASPPSTLSGRAEGERLLVAFDSAQSPGADYALSGEVEDLGGNRTRFLVRFAGWNDRAPPLRISEVQTGKNGSATRPHRDFIELEALAEGNIGGEELSWSSSVKTTSYRFPGIEVKKGDYIVLHLSPEGKAEEVDELGSDCGLSGGIDATASGRDLWCSTLALPDSSGIIALALRPGEKAIDGLFYAEAGKSGALGTSDLASGLSSLAEAGIWPLSGESPSWEDGFGWKASGAKSMCRSASTTASIRGKAAWYITAAGAQSPGAANAGPEAADRNLQPGAKVKKKSKKK
jgi:hypothetical protein